MDHLLSVRETCDRLGISRTTFYRLADRGELRTVKLGRHRKVRESDLDAFIESLDRESAGAA